MRRKALAGLWVTCAFAMLSANLAAAPALTVSATSVPGGSSVTATLTGGAGGAFDWLALAAVGAPDTIYLQWTYVGAGVTTRTWPVTMPATAGTYEFRLFLNGGFGRAATSAAVTVTAAVTAPPALTVNTTNVAAGGSVTATLTGGLGGSADWLALAAVGAPDSSYLQWTYVGAGVTTRAWPVTMPLVGGAYEFRLFLNNSSTHTVTSPSVTVQAAAPPTLTPSVTSVAPGGSVTVTLANGLGGSLDWLALAAVGAADTSYLQWTYVGGGVSTRPWTVTMPTTVGNYEFRLFLNYGFTRAATSPSVSTAPPTSSTAPTTYSAISDRVSRPKPALPALGPAGYRFNDPTFSSTIIRVTDASTRQSALNVSYRTPAAAPAMAWNSASTYFYVVSTDGTVIPYSFDANAMRASRMAGAGDGGLVLGLNGEPAFSQVNPNVIYGVSLGGNNRTIAKYDFSTGAYSTVLDLDTVVGGLAGTYTGALATGGATTENMTVVFGAVAQDLHHYLLWFPINNPGARKLIDTTASTLNGVPTNVALNFRLHALVIDKSGRYVFLYPTAPDLGAPRYASQAYLWDTTTDIITAITSGGLDGSPNALPGGHATAGFGYGVNHDCCTSSTWDAGQWVLRSLANPLAPWDLISPVLTPQEVYLSEHPSWNNAQPNVLVPVLVSTYRYGNNTTAWRAWDDEVIAIETNASVGATVWRFAHHRSAVASDTDPLALSFWYTPRANIAPNGRWAIFTSNWEKTLGTDARDGQHRQDVFLVNLP